MDVISYRGPGAAGGVSSGLGNAWRQQQHGATRWWFLADQNISVLEDSSSKQPKFVAFLDEKIVKGHYRYCNEFLWPILHDLAHHAVYRQEDQTQYRRFNLQFAQHISYNRLGSLNQFVQDYQLALVPAMMADARCVVFWHIPWPKNVPDEHVEALAEVARGILSSQVVGFHTTEFVNNFMNFIQSHLPEYQVDVNRGLVTRAAASPSLIELGSLRQNHAYVLRPYVSTMQNHSHGGITKLVVKPLGIDASRWQETASKTDLASIAPKLPAGILNKRFVLSVDRADYTKAVLERLHAIDQFLHARPDARGEVQFMQVCGRSRAGLQAFDNYWERCRSLFEQVNAKWKTDDWQPIHWIQESLSPEELAAVYRRSAVMLVNPVRDGLNLTAKEYTACQGDNAGVLLLSPGAGSWHEIGNFCLPAHPHDTMQVVNSLSDALSMSSAEKHTRNMLAKIKLERASLQKWWRYFQRATSAAGTRRERDDFAAEDGLASASA